jgi:hypothetical protein
VNYSTEEGTATEGQDYKGSGGTLTFQPGEGVKQITVRLISDDQTEPDETFDLVLSGASGSTVVMRDHMTITIKDAPGWIATPKLAISPAGAGKIALSWEGDSNYDLERTTNPASGQWEKVSCTPAVSGTRCEVVESAGGVVYLYRLRAK